MPKHCETVLYAEDNWDVPNILKVLGKHDSIKKYVIALHDQDVLADGTITPDNFHEYVRPTLYVDIKTKMERAWQYYDQDFQRKTEGTRDCVTIYAYGQSGTGKSTICRLYAKELGLTVYKATCGKDCLMSTKTNNL